MLDSAPLSLLWEAFPAPSARAELGLLHSLTVIIEHQLYVSTVLGAGHVRSNGMVSAYEETSRRDRVTATATVECETGQK